MTSFTYPFNKSILVTKKTTELTPHTFQNNGIWEFNEIQYFYKRVFESKKDKLNIIDIGAQTGLYTLFAKFVDNATFYAFEPFTPCFDALNENIQLNNISNVKTFNIAISDKKEKKILRVPSHKGLSTLGDNPKRFSDYNTIEVQCDTIDNLFYDTNIPIDFIKCDTEGWEYYVLMGGLKTIKKYKPIIQIEYNSTNMLQCNIKPEMLDKLMNELEYVKTYSHSEEYVYEPVNL